MKAITLILVFLSFKAGVAGAAIVDPQGAFTKGAAVMQSLIEKGEAVREKNPQFCYDGAHKLRMIIGADTVYRMTSTTEAITEDRWKIALAPGYGEDIGLIHLGETAIRNTNNDWLMLNCVSMSKMQQD